MYSFPIGVILDSFKLDTKTAIEKAAKIGVIPNDKNHERYKIIHDACYTLSRYADEVDSHFAIETGPEIAVTLKEFLDALNSNDYCSSQYNPWFFYSEYRHICSSYQYIFSKHNKGDTILISPFTVLLMNYVMLNILSATLISSE